MTSGPVLLAGFYLAAALVALAVLSTRRKARNPHDALRLGLAVLVLALLWPVTLVAFLVVRRGA